tara:strand:- start:241 stop:597 length:357 start_codon:yes stop_codon:yes gene_type:complete
MTLNYPLFIKMEYLHTHTKAEPGWHGHGSIPDSEHIIANGSKKILVLLYSDYIVVPGTIQQYKHRQTSHGMKVSKVTAVPESNRESIDSVVRKGIRGIRNPHTNGSYPFACPINFWRQ